MDIFLYTPFNVALNIIVVFASILVLWKGADFLVDSASRVAERLGVSDLVIGLTVVAMGTSAPEFAVTMNAALRGQPDISVGNIVGSNIFNLGFILGTVAIIKSVEASRRLVYRDCVFMILVTAMLFFFFRDFMFTRLEGAIMVAALAAYLIFLFLDKVPLEDKDLPHDKATWKDGLVLPLSIAAVVAGGHLLVGSAIYLAGQAGVSQWAIGVTIIAAGTSAPEMAASIAAVLKGKHGMSAGNLIGSDIFNILGILGLTGIIHPMAITPGAFSSFLMLNAMVVLVFVFFRTGWKISRTEGFVLVGIGIFRWVFDFMK